MATATLVKKAQKDIYCKGKLVSYVSKKGKREGQTLTKIDKTIPANETDEVYIKKGESYYYWGFKNGPIRYSKTCPRRSQLTQSNFLSQYYAIQESVEDFQPTEPEEIESFIEDIKSELENLRDETEGSLDNMPEGLQSGPIGELLQERIDSLENVISELENIDLDYSEPDEDEIKNELMDGDEDLEPTEETIEEKKREKIQEWLDEKLEELNGLSFE